MISVLPELLEDVWARALPREAAAQNEVLRMFLAANSFRATRTFSPRPCATFTITVRRHEGVQQDRERPPQRTPERCAFARDGSRGLQARRTFNLIEVFTIFWKQPPERPRIQIASA